MTWQNTKLAYDVCQVCGLISGKKLVKQLA